MCTICAHINQLNSTMQEVGTTHEPPYVTPHDAPHVTPHVERLLEAAKKRI
jgi:hypothetical protein